MGPAGPVRSFVVSGFTGLIYESIWSHYLKLFLGHAAYAQTLVLAIFMGGMAIGVVARRAAIRGRMRAVCCSATRIVEGVDRAAAGWSFTDSSSATTDWAFDSVIPSLGSPLPHARCSSGRSRALLILPQSVLLGMTFPLMSDGIIRRWPERPARSLVDAVLHQQPRRGVRRAGQRLRADRRSSACPAPS